MSEDSFASLMARASVLVTEDRCLAALDPLAHAEQMARRAEDERGLIRALSLKSHCLYKVGSNVEAERAKHEAVVLELRQHRRNAKALANEQKYADAEKEYREALRICEKNLGANHSETATCMDNLASCLRMQGRLQEALMFAKPALETRLHILGLFHDHTAQSLSNTGHLYRLLARFEEAEDALGKSLVVREKLLGVEHPCVAESLDRLASLRRDQGRFDDAINLGERALKIRKEKLGPDHILTGASQQNLAISRERRPVDIRADASDSNGDGCEPCIAEQPIVVVDDPSTQLRERHAAGYWIVGASIAALSIAAVIYLYAPWIAAVFAIVVAVILALGLSGLTVVDEWWSRGGDRIKKMMNESVAVDRDAVVLGNGSSAAGERIASISRKGPLSVDDARELVRLGVDPLDLVFVHSLTQAAADELAKHRGTLKLSGIVEVKSKLAKSLRWHRGRLELDGVHEFTEAAAAHISRHDGDLRLNGLRELAPFVARHLAHHRGLLELNGVRTMTEEAAGWIIKHRGGVHLHECRLVSEETKRILRSAPQIEFPYRDASA
ncbi:MAG: tetratricopeptide repeat protein [Planctomycetaceae bacterium]